MAGELPTDVLDDSESCRSAAKWLEQAISGVKQVGDTVYRQRGDSESFWTGDAGDACRTSLTDEGKDSDDAEQMIDGVRRALLGFADEIDSVKSEMNSARQDALSAGLIVTPNAILPPGPAPAAPQPPPLGQPETPQEKAQHAAAARAYKTAVVAYDAKQSAFNRAQADVKQAQFKQYNAHQALDKAMIAPLAGIKSLKSYTVYVVGSGLGYIRATHNDAGKLLSKANDIETHANAMQAIADDPNLPEASRAAATRSASVSTDGAERTLAEYQKVMKPITNIPEPIQRGIAADPGNLIIEDGSKLLKLGKGVLKRLPYVGTIVSVGSAIGNIGLGESPGQAFGELAGGLAGAEAGGEIGAGIGAGIGSVIPGAGTAVGGVVGGVIGGIVGFAGDTSVADHLMGKN